MRTTVELDDDVAEKLRQMAARGRTTLRAVINDVLRRGLSAQRPRSERKAAYAVQTFNSGFCAGVDPLKLNQLVDELEVSEGRKA
ncbi:MAG TPA: ribbon-helix-helix protein, CopG family [Polyangiaceae bacterium]|nr:ribbon-helix-helix protein, CopG family [Polyangiaceae bacterium]